MKRRAPTEHTEDTEGSGILSQSSLSSDTESTESESKTRATCLYFFDFSDPDSVSSVPLWFKSFGSVNSDWDLCELCGEDRMLNMGSWKSGTDEAESAHGTHRRHGRLRDFVTEFTELRHREHGV